MLSKDAILHAPPPKVEEVHVPEWKDADGDDVVYVRGMTGAERDLWEMSLTVERGGQMVSDGANATAKALVKCIVTAEGQRVFDDRDANELGAQPAAALMRLWRVARRLSGLGPDEEKAAAENFGEAPGSDSSSISQNGSVSPSASFSP
jgi:hypothetical protein